MHKSKVYKFITVMSPAWAPFDFTSENAPGITRVFPEYGFMHCRKKFERLFPQIQLQTYQCPRLEIPESWKSASLKGCLRPFAQLLTYFVRPWGRTVAVGDNTLGDRSVEAIDSTGGH